MNALSKRFRIIPQYLASTGNEVKRPTFWIISVCLVYNYSTCLRYRARIRDWQGVIIIVIRKVATVSVSWFTGDKLEWSNMRHIFFRDYYILHFTLHVLTVALRFDTAVSLRERQRSLVPFFSSIRGQSMRDWFSPTTEQLFQLEAENACGSPSIL